MKKPAFTLHSPETGTDYWIYVEPAGAQRTEARAQAAESNPLASDLPPRFSGAVAFMDGDDMFAAAVAAYNALRAHAAGPALLLVGVGYGGSFGRPVNQRGRDYTPVNHSDEPASGAADAFLGFLSKTLWPELAQRYPVDPAVRGIAGHSLGSLLVLHALFQPKPCFTHYLASAPSIWWADRAVLRHAAELRARQSALPGQLFLGVGEEDSESMKGDLMLLEKQLAANPFAGLEVISRRFLGKNHFNVLPESFATGLHELFGPEKR